MSGEAQRESPGYVTRVYHPSAPWQTFIRDDDVSPVGVKAAFLVTLGQMRRPGAAPPAAAIAVDWSGAAKGAAKRIWLAEVAGEDLVRLEPGWTADRLTSTLIQRAKDDPSIVVGLDF